ncbi:hypothetical protein [Roseovarius indicus]|nr:hypothetical protein [Roseovarius indicus]
MHNAANVWFEPKMTNAAGRPKVGEAHEADFAKSHYLPFLAIDLASKILCCGSGNDASV